MSAYVNDPRVAARPDGIFHVDDGDAIRCVCPGLFGGFVAHSRYVDNSDGMGFDTADEAIRSLIGGPAVSAYTRDPRVRYDETTGGLIVTCCPNDADAPTARIDADGTGGFVAVSGAETKRFTTVDDALRDLIGDPR